MSILQKRVLIAVAVVALAVLGSIGTARIWIGIGGAPLSIHGWVAMVLGIGGTVALAWVLMALAFRSDRDGWDDRADSVAEDEAADSKIPPPPET
ncbi:hypothetical protein [uncultured Brevundimonas sp.]|mgnify:CR=1 FL=1|uniref:hypothetical protein n=1 Tax=uncultured Brevundimonas sp. TaxID=213418 RepID=UPI0030EF0D6E|tara:strand:- start:63701 stop:63985 length:285 start_codon:yes stop_codon:yes gene_type:complete